MTQAETALKKQETPREIRVVQDDGEFLNLLDTARFEHMYRVAGVFAGSTIIPEHYRSNVGNCFIALQMATRLRVDPFMFMQNTYVVYGRPGMEAKLVIALINSSGLFTDSLEFETEGDNPKAQTYRVRAFAIRKSTGKRVEGPWVDWEMVKSEGWLDKGGSKWKTIPGLMFNYRAAALFGRVACPERLMGMQTAEELEDTGPSRFIEGKAEPVNTRLSAILPTIEGAASNGSHDFAATTEPKVTRNGGGRPAAKTEAPTPKPAHPSPTTSTPPAPTVTHQTLHRGYTMPLPAGVPIIDWLGLSQAEVYGAYDALSGDLRAVYWSHITAEVQDKITEALRVIDTKQQQDAGAEGSQILPKEADEAQEFVDSKDVAGLKVWMSRQTDDLRKIGREAVGIANMTEANEQQVRAAAYAMRIAQAKK